MLARHLQALRTGSPAALASLIAVSGAYGFLHALGPGHGKLLVAGAAVGSRATAAQMAAIAIAGSLSQAVLAVALVYGAFTLFAVTAREAASRGELLEPLGHVAVAAIGAWLAIRGLRAVRRPPACGHAHGPGPETSASLREATAIVVAMALRPCTGALVVLVLAWRFDLALAGAVAALAMGLGTAAFTTLVAFAAVGGRQAMLLSAGSGRAAGHLGAALQIAVGVLILAVGADLLVASFSRS